VTAHVELNPTKRIQRVLGEEIIVEHILDGALHVCEGTLHEFHPNQKQLRVGGSIIDVPNIRLIIRGERVVHRNPAVFTSNMAPAQATKPKVRGH